MADTGERSRNNVYDFPGRLIAGVRPEAAKTHQINPTPVLPPSAGPRDAGEDVNTAALLPRPPCHPAAPKPVPLLAARPAVRVPGKLALDSHLARPDRVARRERLSLANNEHPERYAYVRCGACWYHEAAIADERDGERR